MSLDDDYDEEVRKLYQRHAGRIHGYLRNLGTDPDLAAQFTNDGFLAARRRWAKIRHYERPESYVFKVARNQSHRHHKRRHHRDDPPGRTELDVQSQDAWDDPSHEVIKRLDLRAAVQQLPVQQREVVRLRYLEGFSVAETADILGVVEGTVKRYTYNALRRLAGLLDDGVSGEEER